MNHTKVNVIQLKTIELELDFAEYIQYSDVRIADFACPPIYHQPEYELFSATRFIQFQTFEKIELGALSFQPP